jgi:uncharacterized protein
MTRIDAHAHIGRWESTEFTPEQLIGLMEPHKIDIAVISNLEGIGRETAQAPANNRTRTAVTKHPDRFRGLVWVNPWTGTDGLDDTKTCLDLNRQFVGLKFHPFHNAFLFDSAEVRPFLSVAKEYGVPVAVHTAFDQFSHPKHVIEVAGESDFASVNFILYHAGLSPPDAQAGIEVLRQAASLPNIYIDISWLDLERLKHALEIVPVERILFGTDLPLGGPEHYREYFEKLEAIQLTDNQRSRLMEVNSRELFTRL